MFCCPSLIFAFFNGVRVLLLLPSVVPSSPRVVPSPTSTFTPELYNPPSLSLSLSFSFSCVSLIILLLACSPPSRGVLPGPALILFPLPLLLPLPLSLPPHANSSSESGDETVSILIISARMFEFFLSGRLMLNL